MFHIVLHPIPACWNFLTAVRRDIIDIRQSPSEALDLSESNRDEGHRQHKSNLWKEMETGTRWLLISFLFQICLCDWWGWKQTINLLSGEEKQQGNWHICVPTLDHSQFIAALNYGTYWYPTKSQTERGVNQKQTLLAFENGYVAIFTNEGTS